MDNGVSSSASQTTSPSSPLELDKPQCNCGVVGAYNHRQAAAMTYYALHSLQHRGQEAAGIVARRYNYERQKFYYYTHKDEGLVLDVFDEKVLTEKLEGNAAVGHNRYSTTGSASAANIQPFFTTYRSGGIALAHNGNLTNTVALRKYLQYEGSIFQTTTDSEIFLHLIARSKKDSQTEQIRDALQTAKGAYSLVILTDNALYAARDPHGFRPLCIGRKKNDDGSYAYFVVSETCALDIISAEYVRDVRHNEIVIIDDEVVKTGEIKSFNIEDTTPEARHCIFEYIYFSRPDSKIFGYNVDRARRKLGKNLAGESPVPPGTSGAVTVIAVPDSGNTATLGFARVNHKHGFNTKFEIGLIRSHYVGRTFIAPGQDKREFKVKTKFNIVRGVLEGRKIVVVDDSIVRGTTSRSLIKLIREAQPEEVHLRITSPPVKYPCKYGMDFPSREELIANHYPDEQGIGDELGVDSLCYLSFQGLMNSVPSGDGIGYCTACFTGHYPVEVDVASGKLATEE
ncbi:MAG: amidophosphoribosyltransferase [Bacteroidetes bacterium]|nr:amidophosphoribosyltransferase [Bacteroidota bacterium]MCZ2132020.1 amidophosphoribosyltransferase [Bacteroidota bacterium]